MDLKFLLAVLKFLRDNPELVEVIRDLVEMFTVKRDVKTKVEVK